VKSARRWLLPAAALVVVLPVLAVNLRTVHGLRWPHDQDLYRDIAQARAFADGFFADPFYSGEHVWYNPLVPAAMALGSRLTGAHLPVLYTRAGPWLGLLALVAFAWLARRLLGLRGAALATAALALLADPDRPGWTQAGPTPWAFAGSVTQGLAFAAVVAGRAAWLRPSAARVATAALLLGLTFLGHTAAALAAGTAFVMAPVLHGTDLRRVARIVFATAAGSALVALPFLASIVGAYHLKVLNPEPMAWAFAARDAVPENALIRVARLAVLAPAAVATVRAWRGRRTSWNAAWLLALPVSAALLLGLASGADVLRAQGVALPAVVPAFHFVAYLEAGVVLLAGRGLASLVRGARDSRRLAGLVALVASLAALGWPALSRRMDVRWGRERALELQDRASWQTVRDWLRSSTPPRAVVLAGDEPALFVVAPAGRTVLAVEPVFSNPYVDHASRAEAREALWRALRDGDVAAARATAARWDVNHVLATRVERPWMARSGAAPLLEAGGLSVWPIP
jgi:hypothetical protein